MLRSTEQLGSCDDREGSLRSLGSPKGSTLRDLFLKQGSLSSIWLNKLKNKLVKNRPSKLLYFTFRHKTKCHVFFFQNTIFSSV